MGCALWRPFAIAMSACVSACSPAPSMTDAGADATPPRWQCPEEWVPYARGGCAPAVIACAPDGGAATGACDSIDLSHATPIDIGSDAGTGSTFTLDPSGEIRGAWHEAGEPDGPPDPSWAPDAGIPSCPTDHGWTRASDGTCDPMLPADCGVGGEPLPGGACTDTRDTDCPTDAFADISSETSTAVYVLAGADAASADGTRAHPDPTIAAAIARAGANGWVLIGEGRYAETIEASSSIHLVGRCAASTVIAPSSGSRAMHIAGAAAGDVDVRNITFAGGTGVRIDSGAHARLSRVAVRDAAATGIAADGASTRVTVEDVAITGTTLPSPPASGISANAGAVVTASRLSIRDTHGIAVDVRRGSIVLGDSLLRGIADVRMSGPGVYAAGGEVTANRMVVVDAAAGGVIAQSGAIAHIADSIVRGSREWTGSTGAGIEADDNGAAIDVTRTLLENNVGNGARARGAGASMSVADSVVRGGVSFRAGSGGYGLGAALGGRLVVSHTLVDGNRENGIAFSGGSGEVRDSIVRGTRPNASGSYGWGVEADYDAVVLLDHDRIENNALIGVSASSGGGTVVTVRDTVIDQRARVTATDGWGINVQCHAELDATRVIVIGAVDVGVNVVDVCPEIGGPAFTPGNSTLVFDGSIVRGTRASAARLDSGFGGTTGTDAHSRWIRSILDDNVGFGIAAGGDGAQVVVSDTWIHGTRPARDGSAGEGIVLVRGAALDATRLFVDGSEEFGIVAVHEAQATLTDVIVRGVSPSSRNEGIGVAAVSGGSITASRLALRDVAGAGVAALSRNIGEDVDTAASMHADDLFVSNVRDAVIDPANTTPAAYGAHASAGSALDLTRSVLDGSEYGFYNAGVRFELHDAAVCRQRAALGANSGTGLVVERVVGVENASDIVVTNVSLPSAGGLPLPALPSGCDADGCH